MSLKLEDLKLSYSQNSFLLVDRALQNKVSDLAELCVLEHPDFLDWSLVSNQGSQDGLSTLNTKAILLFPSEMSMPFEEMKSFISSFDQVIVVDSAPSFCSPGMSTFCMGLDERLEEIDRFQYFERLSFDKALLIKNLKAQSSFEVFLSDIEKRIEYGDCFFLVADDLNKTTTQKRGVYIYPTGSGQVKMVDKVTDFGDTIFLAVGRGSKTKLMLKIKSFIAHNAYP